MAARAANASLLHEDCVTEASDRLRLVLARLRLDACALRTIEPQAVLDSSEGTVRISYSTREADLDEAHGSRHPQQRGVAEVADQLGMFVGVGKHQVLHDELDVDHAATIVLEVEESARVRVTFEHPLAHRCHLAAQLWQVARPCEDPRALVLELDTERRLAAAEAGA